MMLHVPNIFVLVQNLSLLQDVSSERIGVSQRGKRPTNARTKRETMSTSHRNGTNRVDN